MSESPDEPLPGLGDPLPGDRDPSPEVEVEVEGEGEGDPTDGPFAGLGNLSIGFGPPSDPLPGLDDPTGDRYVVSSGEPPGDRPAGANDPTGDPTAPGSEDSPSEPTPDPDVPTGGPSGVPDYQSPDPPNDGDDGPPRTQPATTEQEPPVERAGTALEARPNELEVAAAGTALEARPNELEVVPRSSPPPGLSAYLGRLESNVDAQGRGRIRWVWGIGVVLLIGAILAGAAYFVERSRHTANVAFSPPMEFGIYPGGPVGTVKITDSPVAEDPARRLAALEALRATNSSGGPRPFVVRLYESFTGQPTVDSWSGTGANATTDGEITTYSENGFDIDLVVRYEPVTSSGLPTVQRYLTFVRQLVQRYGPNSNVRYLQVGNEVNSTTSPQSSDGAYNGAVQALVYGVEAASQEAGRDGHPQLQVGFNWAYEAGSGVDQPLWTFIKSQGLAFQKSVSWVGLDDYPGSFSDLTTKPKHTGPTLVTGVGILRSLMLKAGLAPGVAIHIAETGYPTGPGRSQASQVVALTSLVNSVNSVRKQYNVNDFEWFDLRDSNSKIQNKQEQYGLTMDNYRAKPAFRVYKQLVNSLGP